MLHRHTAIHGNDGRERRGRGLGVAVEGNPHVQSGTRVGVRGQAHRLGGPPGPRRRGREARSLHQGTALGGAERSGRGHVLRRRSAGRAELPEADAENLDHAVNLVGWGVDTVKKKVFTKLIASYRCYSHNGCRLKKKKRIKVRTRTRKLSKK